ncbi:MULTISPECIES: 30S ribosomal protein S8 [Dictyoglomus]|uniref:Small ribosomal subunit protein uS8 n=1 Tax=Dictyoglomus turgidum (strain DSM 6724 / Z-1310) TaxID=515635 RepID=RS8_DICTD|nr:MULTISPECIES: 30S ribosomal protein S8 [Dictyoglomus]B8E1E7.1 RecName: Full=Small ribosomal subunit protein uS8; AltName: Full=30S ribosomal protein S8 [Dictyoglomus turgidum DSM 6724]ACK42275.1 ribosomal protein S8 [Dictyoglomus turgidum DSM 6724]PNV80590.1 MAG: 30S ribosomal protein S8 [Dictyoglomus turgidum]HBU31954.1 30S ribosomal protein S8 [Dictyoglomus sp.]
MTVTDPIADMLVRIKNANMRRHPTVDVPYSKMKEKIIEILLREGYIAKYEVIGEIPQKYIRVYLKYKGKTPVIQDVKRVSKPGRRYYVNKEEIPRVLGGLGIAILSTSKGIMTDKEARLLGIGGELICMVW